MEAGVGGSRAAAGWIAAAVVLVVAVGVAYLRPSLHMAAAPGPAARAPAAQGRRRPLGADATPEVRRRLIRRAQAA